VAPVLPPAQVDRSSSIEREVTLRTAGGLAVGQGMRDHALRAGPWATLSYAPLELPAALVLRGAVAWASANSVSVRWSTVAIGIETRWPAEPSRAGVILAADGGLSHVIASDQQTASRAVAVVSLFAGSELMLGGRVGLVAGARVDAGPTTQLATPEKLVADRRLKFGGSLGILVKL
jgi:hypothetical protein